MKQSINMSREKIKWFVLLAMGTLPITIVGQEIASTNPGNTVSLKQAQVENKPKESTYRLETFGSYSSGDNTPFWLTSHTWGVAPLDAPSGYLKAGAFHTHTLKNGLSYQLGLDIAGTSKQTNRNNYWIQQAYAGINWRSFALRVGSQEKYQSAIVNEKLSSGDMVYSNNARPNPEIEISIPEYTPIPLSNKKIYIKGNFAIGKYLDGNYLEKTVANYGQSYVKNPLSHHKSVYFRIGDIQWKDKGLQWTFGLNDYAQWSGHNRDFKNNEYTESRPPSKNFLKVVLPIDERTGGSHLSSYNFRIDYGKSYADEIFSLYAQHLIEAKKDIYFHNYKDMLLGVEYKSLRKNLLSGFVLEYLFTKQQTGTNKANYNYYNEPSHPQGITYYGRTTANPLLLSPEYNEDGFIGFKSNRIFALHTGFEGYFSKTLQYSLLATYSDSKGTYAKPFSSLETGVATALDVTYYYPKTQGLTFKCSLGYNNGKTFGSKAFGAGLTIRKSGKLF